MKIVKDTNCPYYVATQNGHDYLGYSHYEAMSRALDANQPKRKLPVSDIIYGILLVPLLALLVWGFLLIGCAVEDRPCGDDLMTRTVAKVINYFHAK